MSPLHVQVQNIDGSEWVNLGKPLEPGEGLSSISNNPEGGRREVLFFQCEPDDKSSSIYKAIRTVEQETGDQRTLTSSELETPIILRDGQKFELNIRTDLGHEARVRFIHKER